jgi:hypothetical protein
LATAVLAPATPDRLRCRWIIGPRVDLGLVIGSSLAGYLYLLLHVIFQVPFGFLWWFWSVGFDGTHIFGTASRTYFDREARRNQRALLFGSLALFFSIGPLLVLAGRKGELALMVGIWAYYHVMRQHYGFLVLYKVKNGDRGGQVLDRAFLGAMLIFPPFHRFLIHHPRELGLPARIAIENTMPLLEPALWTGLAALLLVYAANQARLYRARVPLNVPKLLLLAGVCPLHFLTFAYMSWQAAVPTITIVHNLQYHALIWFHNRNRYAAREETPARNGRIPAAVTASLASYAALATWLLACSAASG